MSDDIKHAERALIASLKQTQAAFEVLLELSPHAAPVHLRPCAQLIRHTYLTIEELITRLSDLDESER